jgi:hypothetical protein
VIRMFCGANNWASFQLRIRFARRSGQRRVPQTKRSTIRRAIIKRKLEVSKKIQRFWCQTRKRVQLYQFYAQNVNHINMLFWSMYFFFFFFRLLAPNELLSSVVHLLNRILFHSTVVL